MKSHQCAESGWFFKGCWDSLEYFCLNYKGALFHPPLQVEDVHELELRVHMMEKADCIIIGADIFDVVVNLLFGPR